MGYCFKPSEAKPIAIVGFGPEFEWRGPTEQLELQGFRRPKPELWDVAFLSRGVDQAASVCRIEVEGQGAIGTGFLLSQDLLLTNYHVIEDGGLADDPSRWRLCFGRMTSAIGTETTGQTFRLADNPIVRSSSTDELDYVLLRVESAILEADTIRPVNQRSSAAPMPLQSPPVSAPTPNRQPISEPVVGIAPRRSQTTPLDCLPIKVANPPSIRDPLALARSLRPLMRQVPSEQIEGLDEQATAQQIAEAGIWHLSSK